jgi:hypothetical protein
MIPEEKLPEGISVSKFTTYSLHTSLSLAEISTLTLDFTCLTILIACSLNLSFQNFMYQLMVLYLA